MAPALIRAADRVCVLSPDHADSVPYLRRAGASDPAKLIEMPNGVDAELFSPGADAGGLRERLGIGADALVAAFVATLDRAHHFKRLDVAIDALAELGERRRRTSSSPAAASCSTASAPGPAPPGSPTGSTSSAPSPTPSCPTCSGPPTCSCSRPSRRSRSGSS